MEVRPDERLIVRRIENKDVENCLAFYSSVLNEVVDFGSIILSDLFMNQSINQYTRMTVGSFLRYSLGIVDSISLLLTKSACEPCDGLLRILLEHLIWIKYVIQDDTERRAIAYFLSDIHEQIRIAKQADHSTDIGRQFQAKKSKDEILKKHEFPNIICGDQVVRANRVLDLPEYREIATEFQRMRKANGKLPKWYQLFNGPRNIIGAAERVELQGIYEILYRSYSKAIHGSQLIHTTIEFISETLTAIPQIRNTRDATQQYEMTFSITLSIYKNIVKSLLPQLNGTLAKWYLENMREKRMNPPRIVVR